MRLRDDFWVSCVCARACVILYKNKLIHFYDVLSTHGISSAVNSQNFDNARH